MQIIALSMIIHCLNVYNQSSGVIADTYLLKNKLHYNKKAAKPKKG